MIAEKMKELVQGSSVIRAMFEEGKRLAALHGAENVFDFSLGNPNVAAPAAVNEAVIEVLENLDAMQIHGYMNNSGHEYVRAAIAASINAKFGTRFSQDNIIMTVGAAWGIQCILKTLPIPGISDTFAPFFGNTGAIPPITTVSWW